MVDCERDTTDDELAGGDIAPARVDDAPFRATFEEQRVPVRHMLLRLGARPPDLDDLTQEVFLVLHRRRDGYDRARPLGPWLHGIAARVVIAHRRRARHKAELPDDGAVLAAMDEAPLPDRAVELRQECTLVIDALGALDGRRRALLLMHDLDGTAMPEIASALGVALNTAYSRLRLARAALLAAVKDLRRMRRRAAAGRSW